MFEREESGIAGSLFSTLKSREFGVSRSTV